MIIWFYDSVFLDTVIRRKHIPEAFLQKAEGKNNYN